MGRTAQPAVTSGECLWKGTKREVKPARLSDIKFQRPSTGKLTAASAKVRKFSSSAGGTSIRVWPVMIIVRVCGRDGGRWEKEGK